MRARPTLVREQREKQLEEKRLEEQAAIDRKRWIEQQEQAAKAKVVADKLAKEQARRDAEQQKIENVRARGRAQGCGEASESTGEARS